MSERLQERERIGSGETVRLFAEAFGYLRPFRARMAVKVALTLLSLLPGLLLPFPIKILIDHVVLEQPPATEVAAAARTPHLILISARSETALRQATANLIAHLRETVGELERGNLSLEASLKIRRRGSIRDSPQLPFQPSVFHGSPPVGPARVAGNRGRGSTST